MSYYDKQFEPWTIVDGQLDLDPSAIPQTPPSDCKGDPAKQSGPQTIQTPPKRDAAGQVVVADESEWQNLFDLERVCVDYPKCPHCKYFEFTNSVDCGVPTHVCHDCRAETPQSEWYIRPTVKIVTDVFADVAGPVVNSDGAELLDGINWPEISPVESLSRGKLTVRDLLDGVFKTIDLTPHVDYLLMTQRPELVRSKWPTEDDGHNGKLAAAIFTGDPFASGKLIFRRPNIILAVPVETQNDVEQLVPKLVKCQDLCKGLAVVCNPKEELDFNFKPLLGNPEGYTNFAIEYLNLVIAEGNEHPIHTDHLRSLRDQCSAANVEFNFAGWGRWVPLFGHFEYMEQGLGTSKWIGINHDGTTLEPGFGNRSTMVDVGKDKSGRLLDGVEHNGRIT